MLRRIWSYMWSPAARFSIAGLFIAGGITGIVFWGGFNTFMEYTNTEEFCISCHEMRDNVYVEYKDTIHYKSASGVRATCSDCHVPKDWTAKLIRKVQATNELYHKLVGTIDTREKFEKHRIELAERVWATMEANDSRECRNCHSFEAMDFHKQDPIAAERMQQAMEDGDTCISCHKGIAHKMPDLAARAREQQVAFMSQTEALKGDKFWTKRTSAVLSGPETDAGKIATILPGVTLTKLERQNERIKVLIEGWQAGESNRGQYALFGKRILNLSIAKSAVDKVTTGESRYYDDGDQDWTQTALEGWVNAADLTEDLDMLWNVTESIYSSQCGVCHSTIAPGSKDSLSWQADVQAYQDRTSLTAEEKRLVLRFLQLNASDTKTIAQ